MPAPSVDIAIVNFRCVADTLEALARLAHWPHGTIWLVDNSAHEPAMAAQTAALRLACGAMPGVVYIEPGDNLGFGRACNLAFAKSNAEFFLLLNPDARIGGEPCDDEKQAGEEEAHGFISWPAGSRVRRGSRRRPRESRRTSIC